MGILFLLLRLPLPYCMAFGKQCLPVPQFPCLGGGESVRNYAESGGNYSMCNYAEASGSVKRDGRPATKPLVPLIPPGHRLGKGRIPPWVDARWLRSIPSRFVKRILAMPALQSEREPGILLLLNYLKRANK